MAGPVDAGKFPLLNLPAEIRVMIYRVFLPDQDARPAIELRRGGQYITRLPELNSFEATHSVPPNQVLASAPQQSDISVTVNKRGREGDIVPLMVLAKVCRQLRSEVMPIFRQQLIVRAVDFNAACWYGRLNPLFTKWISDLTIAKPPIQSDTLARWLKQLLAFFPNLQRLYLDCMSAHKDERLWGTKWKVDDLRAMQYVVNNSALKTVIHWDWRADWHGLKWVAGRHLVSFHAYDAARLAMVRREPGFLDVDTELAKGDAKTQTMRKRFGKRR